MESIPDWKVSGLYHIAQVLPVWASLWFRLKLWAYVEIQAKYRHVEIQAKYRHILKNPKKQGNCLRVSYDLTRGSLDLSGSFRRFSDAKKFPQKI